MENRGVREINCLINKLTNDEDHRQQLWLYYVSGGSTDNFESKLDQITREQKLHSKFCEAVAQIYSDPIPEKLVLFVSNFSDFERSIIFLLMLGFTVTEVSEYKGISEVRIKQSIVAIKKHTIWEKTYGKGPF